MKHLVLAFALVAFAAGCRSTSQDSALSDAGAPPAADCCAKDGACADKAGCDKAATCDEGKVCPVTGKSME